MAALLLAAGLAGCATTAPDVGRTVVVVVPVEGGAVGMVAVNRGPQETRRDSAYAAARADGAGAQRHTMTEDEVREPANRRVEILGR